MTIYAIGGIIVSQGTDKPPKRKEVTIMKFSAEVKLFRAVNDFVTVTIETEKPQDLLFAVKCFGFTVPTVDSLLNHLFVDGFAYANQGYTITVK